MTSRQPMMTHDASRAGFNVNGQDHLSKDRGDHLPEGPGGSGSVPSHPIWSEGNALTCDDQIQCDSFSSRCLTESGPSGLNRALVTSNLVREGRLPYGSSITHNAGAASERGGVATTASCEPAPVPALDVEQGGHALIAEGKHAFPRCRPGPDGGQQRTEPGAPAECRGQYACPG